MPVCFNGGLLYGKVKRGRYKCENSPLTNLALQSSVHPIRCLKSHCKRCISGDMLEFNALYWRSLIKVKFF